MHPSGPAGIKKNEKPDPEGTRFGLPCEWELIFSPRDRRMRNVRLKRGEEGRGRKESVIKVPIHKFLLASPCNQGLVKRLASSISDLLRSYEVLASPSISPSVQIPRRHMSKSFKRL